ncbi:MAG TPA: flagellar biosynthesis protein FliQ [Bacillota bacterium]|jgi:flagellar biosynthetic protein FliQ|nr:flagellar biosynthesis protein FliQ [Candidatus Fermentithermobacillaceae bacterium]HOB29995.1 flagellar biosynthesis protein FliQ [Bacillota bacterium]HOK63866.1 flagellar biosynthesis protein FliQ [Bacillota bacterium]HOL11446.1 flagellar biosynthesis protein FliQ [Bacillota bacterium]HOQ03176.1 flagellar biosynthesis protein FliQ [Bacillota bacterium]
MTLDQVISIGKETIGTTLLIAGPCLVISIAVGLLISIFQATTQIHDQTLSFVPKILAVMISIMIFGGWMLKTLMDFTERLLQSLPGII